ncbi:MAG: hypothetical protein P4L64_04445 [Caulobacteraceae bacterium]|nr:hypothetical protein [Caulobacteraceae bacterium]
MAASACLRIVLDLSEEKLAKLEALGPMVAKVTSAFLETRWSWPKRFEALTPFSFMLTDPRVTEVDVSGLRRLADELQIKLFGASDMGDVILLLHDGEETDTAHFVQMDHAALKTAVLEPLGPTPFGGRLMRMSTADGDASPMMWVNLERDASKAPGTAKAAQAHGVETVYHGVYFTPRQSFVGCGVSSTPANAPTVYSFVDSPHQLPGDEALAFDMASQESAIACLTERPYAGILFTPISFTALMRRSMRAAYDDQFARLPLARRNQLAVAVYDVPRAPPFPAFGQLRDALDRNFSFIDLQISDPGFELDNVPPGIITSVTFRLPEGDERTRLAAMKRFMDKRETFKRRQIWPAITNVRTRAELQACLREHAPFLSGQAVCGPMTEPIGGQPWDSARLPLMHAA